MTPQNSYPKRWSLGVLLRSLSKLVRRGTGPKRDLSQHADIPEYLRRDVGLLPQERRPRSVDPPRINPYKLY